MDTFWVPEVTINRFQFTQDIPQEFIVYFKFNELLIHVFFKFLKFDQTYGYSFKFCVLEFT